MVFHIFNLKLKINLEQTMKNLLLLALLPFILLAQSLTITTQNGESGAFAMADIENISSNESPGTAKWMGQASVKIKTSQGVVIYIDPYAGDDYSEPADIILVTHNHGDHNKVSLVTQAKNCSIIGGFDISGGSKLAVGDTTTIAGIKIKAVHAYNQNHPKGTGVGFVLDIHGTKIYHSGDTSKIDEMTELADMNIDYAFLCTDGRFNMGPEEAMDVAKLIKARKVIPIHRGFSEKEQQNNLDKFTLSNVLKIVEGESFNF